MDKNERENSNLALAVRYGIILDMELGAVSAWTFMASNGVSSSVIMRVLLDKEHRRATDELAINITERYRRLEPSRETIHATFGIPSRRMLAG